VRASRLVNLLLLLQTRGGLTAAELARELEVSVRTVHRDVEELSLAGVPIFAERGPHGGIRLVDGYRTRLTGMTAEEAEGLFLAGLPGPAAQLGLGTVVAAAQLKVLAALPSELRSRASRIVERFHLDVSGWFQADEPVPHLTTLSAAVWDERQVAITYDRGSGAVERTIAPLGLVLKAGVWYVVAAVEDQLRTYRVARVRTATILDGPVVRPPNFELASYWTETSAAYERESPTVTVVVRIREGRLDRLRTIFGDRVVASAERLEAADPEGWWHLRFRVPWPDEVPALLLGVGSGMEVLDPPDIRDRLAATAARVVERYRVVEPEVAEPPKRREPDDRSAPSAG
jgi:predicted DNA-binding transcriptional regulator YafY